MARKVWHVVYTLRDADGNVRYVGCTCQPLAWRLQQHSYYKGPTGEWIRSERRAGREVTIHAEKRWLRFPPADYYEKHLINEYRKAIGPWLLNREIGRKKTGAA